MLDAPTRSRAATPEAPSPRRASRGPSLRRDLSEDFAGGSRRAAAHEDEERAPGEPRRAPGLRLKLGSRIPRSIVGRSIAGMVVLAGLGGIAYGLVQVHTGLMHDGRLTIPSSSAIEISGNNHLTRPQLLSVFGEDVDRNILTVPLENRRAELETLPWVEHATVMRLLPNRVRVAIVERTPVAFVRQGSEIGLVDAHGVLLDLAPDLAADHAYSFPVVTGIQSSDPLGTRAARMKLYLQFTGELNSGADTITGRLSEIDLTDPEDVKALIPDNGSLVLVHFGDTDFLTRYQRYVQNLPEWKTKYPKLASVDMRYEHEVVLEMQPGAAVPIAANTSADKPAATAPAQKAPVAKKLAVVRKPAPAKLKPAAPVPGGGHLQQAFDVHPKAGPR